MLQNLVYIDSHSGVPELNHWQCDVLKKLIQLNSDLIICLEIDTEYDTEEAYLFFNRIKKRVN